MSHFKLVFGFQTKVMKLSSISLIAATFAAITGSITAAPTPPPFERGVDIYSHANSHQDALCATLDVAHRAKKLGCHEIAKLHEDDAEWLKHTHDPNHVKWSIKKSRESIATLEHVEAAQLNRLAAPIAKRLGWNHVSECHDKCATDNDAHVGRPPNPDLVRYSKAQAHRTFHAEAFELSQHAVLLAKKLGCPLDAQRYEEFATKNSAFARGTPNPDFYQTSKAELETYIKAAQAELARAGKTCPIPRG